VLKIKDIVLKIGLLKVVEMQLNKGFYGVEKSKQFG
jgi:hypothetical protein